MNISMLLWLTPTILAVVLLYAVGLWPWLWARRVLIGEAATALLCAGLPFVLAATWPLPGKVMLGLVQAWLIIVALRLSFGRLGEAFLRMSTKLNIAIASLLVVATLFVWLLGQLTSWRPSIEQALGLVLALGLIVALAMLRQAIWTLRHYRLRTPHRPGLRDLPTVTLAIPARNETSALTDCLAAAVASDYPKLEILVLDDCSQDKTSQIIRAFAHDGVRFISGAQPAEGWLGKNQATQTLANEALGDLIIFAGVDTRFAPNSISDLVAYAVSRNLSMVSVLPQVRVGVHISSLFQQLRYFWQIVLPATKRRVPVASQCWLIKADALRQLGGFAAVRSKIVPEGWFARRLAGVDLYRFIVSNREFGVTTAKKWHSQAETALRFLYPTFKRQPLYVLGGLLLLSLLVIVPFVAVVVLALSGEYGWLWWLALLTSALLLVCYALVVARTNPLTWPLMVVTLPLCLAQDMLFLAGSMLLYEFGEVNWKGRNVCYPVIGGQAVQAAGHAEGARAKSP